MFMKLSGIKEEVFGISWNQRGVCNWAKSWTQVSEILVEIRDPSRDLKSQAFLLSGNFRKITENSSYVRILFHKLQKIKYDI